MKNILAKKHLTTLTHFASSSVLLGFDYDGTLAPIEASPARARMRASTRWLLRRVALRYPCMVISGLNYRDLARRLGRLPISQLFGNHGRESSVQSGDPAVPVNEWVRHLRERLVNYPSLVVEGKKCLVTVHYGLVADRMGVRHAIAEGVRALPNVRTFTFHNTVNVCPLGGPDKGVALQRARRALGCETAIYVGDDETDEDAFASAPPSQLLSIRVGRAPTSRAGFRLETQADVDGLLETLLTSPGRSGDEDSGRHRW